MAPETQAGPSRGHKLNPTARSFSPSPTRATSVLAQGFVSQNYARMISSSPAQHQPPSPRLLSSIRRQSRPVSRSRSEPLLTPSHSSDSSPRRQPRATCIGIEAPGVYFWSSSYGQGRAFCKRYLHATKMHMMPDTPPDGNAGLSTNEQQPRIRTGIFFPADPRMVYHPPSGNVGADEPRPGHTYFKMPANDDDDGWEELAASISEQSKANNEMQLECQKAHSSAGEGSGS